MEYGRIKIPVLAFFTILLGFSISGLSPQESYAGIEDCSPGFFFEFDTCVICPPDFFCTGIGEPQPCPEGTTSPPGASECMPLESEPIQWDKSRPLTWDDFKGEVPDDSDHDAFTRTNISKDATTFFPNPEPDETVILQKYEVKALFIPDESWVDDTKKTDELLNHEQGHFDIAQIFALKKQNAVDPFVGKTFKNQEALDEKLEKICEPIEEKAKEFEEEYDTKTKHGTDAAEQKKWDDKIKKMLEKEQKKRK